MLRNAANEVAQAHVPDDGRRVFDLKREMPEEWNKFKHQHEHQRFELHLARDMFPYMTGDRELIITRLEFFIGAEGASPSTHREVEFVVAHAKGCAHAEADEHEFQCVGDAAWPGFFHGAVDVASVRCGAATCGMSGRSGLRSGLSGSRARSWWCTTRPVIVSPVQNFL